MKLSSHLILSLLLLMISIICAVATGEFDAVVDSDEDEVKTGEEYYMFALAIEEEQLISLRFSLGSNCGCSPCPLDVVMEQYSEFSLDYGLPLTFHNNKPAGSVVRVSTDVNINFNATSIKSTCTVAESTVWNLEHDRCINSSVVTSGGRLNGWFKFEKVLPQLPTLYKIVSCPNSRDSFAPCGDLVYPADDLNSPQKHLFISNSSPSTNERIFWVLIGKANFTQAPNNFNLIKKNIKGILTSTH